MSWLREIQFGSETLQETHSTQSQAEDAESGGVSVPVDERRREHRYAVHEIVDVHLIGDVSGRFGGMMLDISRSGVRIEVGKPLARGARLEIVVPHRAIILGEARYCRAHNDLYHVGVAIAAVYFAKAAPSQHVAPELLDLYRRGDGLPDIQLKEIRKHLIICELCRDALAAD